MHLVITIDTEEDNWGDYTNTSYSVENIKRIPSLQKIFNEYNVIPTYLVTYPVATNRESIAILKNLLQQGKCEIGMHCHPWSTPPFEEERNPYNSMLCNLPYDLQRKKLGTLHETIVRNFGIRPTSFRAGRWGYSASVATAISELGYAVDTSITPFTDWTEYHGPDFSKMTPQPYRFRIPDVFKSLNDGEMTEVPASIGYLQNNFDWCGSIDQRLNQKLGRILRLKGILFKLNLMTKVWLSPETSDAFRMMQLTSVLISKKFEVVNMFFHSTSLMAGLSFFVKTKNDERQFLNSIREYFTFTTEAGLRPVKLSEAGDVIRRARSL